MVSFFRRGDDGKVVAEDSTTRKKVLSEGEGRLVLVVATVGLVLLALLALALGGRGSALSRCNGILIQSQKNLCLQELASSTGNAPVCGMITAQEQRYSCLVNIAETKGNITFCNEVNRTDVFYPECVLNVSMSTRNASYCQLLDSANQSSCVFNLAKAGKFSSMALCSSISNKSIENECTYLNYYSTSLTSRSSSDCAFLPNETNYTVMSLMLSSNLTNHTDIMQSAYAGLNTTPRNYCYYDLSILTGNRTGCSKVNGVLNGVCNAAFTHSNSTLNIANAPVGSRAYVIGAPKGYEFSVADGLISQMRKVDGMSQYQVSCPISGGNSGGPLVNGCVEVIGVTSWSKADAQNVNFAIPSSCLASLDPSLPPKPWGDSGQSDSIGLRADDGARPASTADYGLPIQGFPGLKQALQGAAGEEVTVILVRDGRTETFSFIAPADD